MGVRGFQSDILENWPLGVITAILKDRLPDGAVPYARNAQFHDLGPQTAIFGTRHGCTVQNSTPDSGAIISQWFLNSDTSDVHLVVNEDGDLSSFSGGTLSPIQTSLFSETSNPFSWQTANNLAFVVNGEQNDQYKTDGVDYWKFGISQPGTGDWSASVGSSGGVLPAGVYQLGISYFNSDTDHEGPISDTKSVTVTAGQKITVNLPNSGTVADGQVDYIKIYILQESTMNELLLVVAGTTGAITGTNGWAVGTSSVVINSSQAEMDAFTVLAPFANDNYPPPADAKFIAEHKSRMFAATDNYIYWSLVDDPESFNTTDSKLPIGQEDGETITGIIPFRGNLVVFKRSVIYVLVGDDPRSWSIQLADSSVGSVAPNGFGVFDNKLFFMSLRGPQMWQSLDGDIVDITTELIGNLFDKDHIDTDSLEDSVIIGHNEQSYVAWAITPSTATRNTTIIPFHFKLQRWMASEWNIVDVRSCVNVSDSTGRQWPILGDYDGFLYKLGQSDADGMPAGQPQTGVSTHATNNTIMDDSNGDIWTTDALVGRYVYVWTDANGVRSAERRRITANDTKQLTVTPNWTVNPLHWNYHVGGIFFDWKSAFRSGGVPLHQKRIEFLFLEIASNNSDSVSFDVEVYTNTDDAMPFMSRSLSVNGGSLWDSAVWDVDVFGSAGVRHFRVPIRTVGYNWQTRVTHMSSGEQIYIYRNAVQWLTKTKKVGRRAG